MKKSKFKFIVFSLILLATWTLIAPFLAKRLVVQKRLPKADAIFILAGAGKHEERAYKASEIFKAGIASKILLTDDRLQGGWDPKTQRNPYFVEKAHSALISLGIPNDAIEILEPTIMGTIYEAQVLRELVVSKKLKSVMLVTSAYHSRRTLWTFEKVLADLNIEMGITTTDIDVESVSPSIWWLQIEGWNIIGSEYLKSLYYWLKYFSEVSGVNETLTSNEISGSYGANSLQGVKWELLYEERFTRPIKEPAEWTEDTYGPDDSTYGDPFSDKGDYFVGKYGERFNEELRKFRAYRKRFTYGKDDWLTVELYGRAEQNSKKPASGGRFVIEQGKAKLISKRHTDGAIIRSTKPLPKRYRVEVTVSNINFGGESNGSWTINNKINGYDDTSLKSPLPWYVGDTSAISQNGVYFLCITDYPKPAPHNNVFIHHHRKVVMDTDNNNQALLDPRGEPWSKVWNPNSSEFDTDGSHYISMIWLQGNDFGSDTTGNEFSSYTPEGWKNGPFFVDKFQDGRSYVFSVERDGESYTMSVTGTFFHGGKTTYRATRKFRESPVTWHYNQTADEYTPSMYNQNKLYHGKMHQTWPPGSFYPDYFFFGDPHINFYEGTAEFSDLKLYVPSGSSELQGNTQH